MPCIWSFLSSLKKQVFHKSVAIFWYKKSPLAFASGLFLSAALLAARNRGIFR